MSGNLGIFAVCSILILSVFHVIWIRPIQSRIKGFNGEKDTLKQAQELLGQLLRYQPNKSLVASNYKFFTPLLEKLIQLQRQFGGSMADQLVTFQTGLEREIEFELKLRDQFRSGLIQVLLLWIVIIFQYFVGCYFIEKELSVGFLLSVTILHFISILGVEKFFKELRDHFFYSHDEFLQCLMTLQLLGSSRLSVQEILEASSYERLCELKLKNLELLELRIQLLSIVHEWKSGGGSLGPKVQAIMRQVQSIRSIQTQKFEKIQKALLFVIMALVSLPSYFWSLIQLTRDVFSQAS
jgi:hypothetical protein